MRIAASGVAFEFDAGVGRLDALTIDDCGSVVAPLHRAPWVGTGESMPEGEAPLMAGLGGDFFCAPFAASEDGAPLHGWPPNAPWDVTDAGAGLVRAVLSRRARGATLTKTLRLRDGHPFVYQTHAFEGGTGRIAVANHANVSVAGGALIRTSPKAGWETPGTPLESDPARGRSALRYPARVADPRAFPGPDCTSDLTRYPWNPRHEDFVVGVEAKGHALGWTAVTRIGAGDVFLSLRDPGTLPMTMLWHSNGGRDYPPWSGRHRACLGVEEGAAAHMLGLSNAADLTGPGAVSLTPDGACAIRHVIGAIAWPSGSAVAEIEIAGGNLVVRGEDRAERTVPIDPAGIWGDCV